MKQIVINFKFFSSKKVINDIYYLKKCWNKYILNGSESKTNHTRIEYI